MDLGSTCGSRRSSRNNTWIKEESKKFRKQIKTRWNRTPQHKLRVAWTYLTPYVSTWQCEKGAQRSKFEVSDVGASDVDSRILSDKQFAFKLPRHKSDRCNSEESTERGPCSIKKLYSVSTWILSDKAVPSQCKPSFTGRWASLTFSVGLNAYHVYIRHIHPVL